MPSSFPTRRSSDLKAGDARKVDGKPEEAYGVRNESLVQDVPREAFKNVDAVEPGMQFKAQTAHGPQLVTVVEVGDEQVKIDGNQPLAGRNLHLAVEWADDRGAAAEEKRTEGRQ